MFPGKYRSDFGVQVTSQIADAQKFTINFANNNLLGSANFRPGYRTSKARVCVTVGMMTTGYNCTDILNLGLFRPIFSPTDFVQIKGRGTRRHDFRDDILDDSLKDSVAEARKTAFKLFDFFGNCEYFETEFNYDEELQLTRPQTSSGGADIGPVQFAGSYEYLGAEIIASVREETISYEGMRIDRMLFEKFEDTVRKNETIADAVMASQWDRVIDYVNREVFDKPEEYYNLKKLRQAAAVDRRLTLREILEKVFGLIPDFKSKDELLEEEFAKFVADCKPDEADAIQAIKTYFKAYATSNQVRDIIDGKRFAELATNPSFFHRRLQRCAGQVPQPHSGIRQRLRFLEPVCTVGSTMLDSNTKRRIDTARDILVGKVPDPKSQVEQITIALIYKFMDDMDAESEEFGGKRSFFAGEVRPLWMDQTDAQPASAAMRP